MQDPQHLLPSKPDQPVVLVVDDEIVILNITRIALEAEGYFILTAQNGQQALEMSRKFPGSIHLLVSDVVMPNMDGLTLRQRLLEERPQTKVLLMSGHSESPPANCAFLSKPFHIRVLKERVRQMLS